MRLLRLLLVVGLLLSAAGPARAQLVVHDPISFVEVFLSHLELVRQLEHLRAQAQRLADWRLQRYRTPALPWALHRPEAALFAGPYLEALNAGRRDLLEAMLDPLRAADAALDRMAPDVRRRTITQAASVELADHVAGLAVEELGALRDRAEAMTDAIHDLERDAVATDDDAHTQIAVLNKINAANVVGLRAQQNTNQLLLALTEQLLADAKRQRDAYIQTLNSRLVVAEEGPNFYHQVFTGVAAQLATHGR